MTGTWCVHVLHICKYRKLIEIGNLVTDFLLFSPEVQRREHIPVRILSRTDSGHKKRHLTAFPLVRAPGTEKAHMTALNYF